MGAKDRHIKNYHCHGMRGHQVVAMKAFSFALICYFHFSALFPGSSARNSCAMECPVWMGPVRITLQQRHALDRHGRYPKLIYSTLVPCSFVNKTKRINLYE